MRSISNLCGNQQNGETLFTVGAVLAEEALRRGDIVHADTANPKKRPVYLGTRADAKKRAAY